MDEGSVFYKVLNFSWVILVFIPIFNGLGFIFAGWRVKETKWIDEGIIYMIPFILISFTIFNDIVLYMILISWIISIIRLFMIIRPYKDKLSRLNGVNQYSQKDAEDNFYKSETRIKNLEKNNSTNNQENKIEYPRNEIPENKQKGRKIDL